MQLEARAGNRPMVVGNDAATNRQYGRGGRAAASSARNDGGAASKLSSDDIPDSVGRRGRDGIPGRPPDPLAPKCQLAHGRGSSVRSPPDLCTRPAVSAAPHLSLMAVPAAPGPAPESPLLIFLTIAANFFNIAGIFGRRDYQFAAFAPNCFPCADGKPLVFKALGRLSRSIHG